jgi:hypothetical protein
MVILVTAIGSPGYLGYATYEIKKTRGVCEAFLEKFRKHKHTKQWGNLSAVQESVLYWKAEFTIEILSEFTKKTEVEKKLTDCLLKLQKTDDGGWGALYERTRDES